MGCDIHMCAEHRQKNGEWVRVLPPEHAYDPWLVENGWDADAVQTWYANRNYALFGVLAGVRSYDDTDPISRVRGLPEDLSDEVSEIAFDDGAGDLFWLGDHSHTWLTLDEILAYDWDRPHAHTTLREWCSEFLTRTVPALQALDPDPRNVRLVFGFDS